MEKYTNIVGVGGNITPPNPRLPSYIIPPLVREDVRTLILVSSLDAAQKNSTNEREKELTTFQTSQKIRLLNSFKEAFFSDSCLLLSSVKSQSDNYDDGCWLQLWSEIESHLSAGERESIYSFFENCKKTSTLEQSKIYAIRHAFWFYDLSFLDHGSQNMQSHGGPQEHIFNIIREAALLIPNERLFSIFRRRVYKNKIEKILYPYTGKVVPYGEATRKTGKTRKSIEFPIGENSIGISEHYHGSHQKKAGLLGDIELIHSYVAEEDYADFFSDFSRNYHQDLLSL